MTPDKGQIHRQAQIISSLVADMRGVCRFQREVQRGNGPMLFAAMKTNPGLLRIHDLWFAVRLEN